MCITGVLHYCCMNFCIQYKTILKILKISGYLSKKSNNSLRPGVNKKHCTCVIHQTTLHMYYIIMYHTGNVAHFLVYDKIMHLPGACDLVYDCLITMDPQWQYGNLLLRHHSINDR